MEENLKLKLLPIIKNAILEDIQNGDVTSLACIDEQRIAFAELIVKEDNIVIAGLALSQLIFETIDKNLKVNYFFNDGDKLNSGNIAFEVEGSARSILMAERLVLNFMQRMSGIATQTNQFVQLVKNYPAKILDTRKTTPNLRTIEKWAVKIGGGHNHRFGLFDMIMIKDNHIDFAGSIEKAILSANKYLEQHQLSLPIEIEVRNLKELDEVLKIGKVQRIMLDNFTPENLRIAIEHINKKYETEASGGITLHNVKDYAATGVDYISVGALTHSVKSIDLSLKAKKIR